MLMLTIYVLYSIRLTFPPLCLRRPGDDRRATLGMQASGSYHFELGSSRDDRHATRHTLGMQASGSHHFVLGSQEMARI